MTTLAVKNEIQDKVNNNQNIIGMEIIGVDGFNGQSGVIESLSVEKNFVLGILAFVWVRWENGNLENFEPRQFGKYSESDHAIGVYYR